MTCSCIFLQLIFSLLMIVNINGLSSPIKPFTSYTYSVELLANTVDLYWSIDSNTTSILFELHVNTIGWIGLGISPAGGMPGADIGTGWVDPSGQLVFQDRYAYGYAKPVIDNTTTDWIGLQCAEQNGWTAIQFKRLLDTCDYMDVPIKSGSTILIFAWGLTDPDPSLPYSDITYHENRRGSLTIPLLSYSQPPSASTLAGLYSFDFRVNNYTLPANPSTYYCQVFKIPAALTDKRHAIAREILINSSAPNLVYHLSLSECDSEAVFDDNNLPSGVCDDNATAYGLCALNIVIGWATGGDYLVEFPDEAGLPVGLNSSTKYYLIQINYYNANSSSGYTDSSGIRLYVANQSRQYDLGGLTFGMVSSPSSLAIPPRVNNFSVDSYCTANASRYNFPNSGLTVFSFFGHTHLQGQSLWTKLVRNHTAVQYLFNAESYSPQYQFDYLLATPIKIYPGDEFVTRCVYNTMNKTAVTLGGHQPTDEMCVQVFNYYPRMNNLYTCANAIAPISWQTLMNTTASLNDVTLAQSLLTINWTSALATQWQTFYNNALRNIAFGRAGFYNVSFLVSLPTYQDINSDECEYQQNNTNVTASVTTTLASTSRTTTLASTSRTTTLASTSSTTTLASTSSTTTLVSTSRTTTLASTSSTTTLASTYMLTTTVTNSSMGTTAVANTTTANNTVITTTASASSKFVLYKTIFMLSLFLSYLMNGKVI